MTKVTPNFSYTIRYNVPKVKRKHLFIFKINNNGLFTNFEIKKGNINYDFLSEFYKKKQNITFHSMKTLSSLYETKVKKDKEEDQHYLIYDIFND